MSSETDLGRRRLRTLGDLAVRVGACVELGEIGPAAVAALAGDLPFVQVHLAAGLARRTVRSPRRVAGGLPATVPAGLVGETAGDGARAPAHR